MRLDGSARSARRFSITLAAALAAGACSSGDGAESVCPRSAPVTCRSDGALVGCCPRTHPVCDPATLLCAPAAVPVDGGSGGARVDASSVGGGAGAGASAGTAPAGSGGGAGTAGTGGLAGEGGAAGGAAGISAGGESGAGGAGGSAGTAGMAGTGCDDVGFEPNGDESSATALAAIDDCDVSGSSVTAHLADGSDVDVYRFDGTDELGCAVDPTASTSASVRLCLYAECSGAAVGCVLGAPATSPLGRVGCCVPSGGTVQLSVDCSGFSDDARVFVTVSGAGQACLPYTVTYHY